MTATIEDDIVEWANQRPAWQRHLLARIVKGEALTQELIDDLAKQIVEGTVPAITNDLTVKDLPASSSAGPTVSLMSIGQLVNVNRLLPEQKLKFAEQGLTVIFGNNGSGKSGYARVAKELAGARDKESVLPNVFDQTSEEQSAEIEFKSNGTDQSVTWPIAGATDLSQLHYYDKKCGDDYLISETELAYRPSVLTVLDSLIAGIDAVRLALERLLATNAAGEKTFPGLYPNTPSADFIRDLSKNTTNGEIDAAVKLPDKSEQLLSDLLQEELRLKGTNPKKEQSRLTSGSKQLNDLAEHFDTVSTLLSVEAGAKTEQLVKDAKTLRAAADVASATDFAKEPLPGVGTETWRALWAAAEAYSISEVDSEADFPAVDETDHCPLCQQPIGKDAGDRLTRFHKFVHNETARKASEAEGKAASALKLIAELQVTTTQVTDGLAFLLIENSGLAAELKEALTVAQQAKDRISARLRGVSTEAFMPLKPVDTDGLRIMAAQVDDRAKKIDSTKFDEQQAKATRDKTELSDRITLSKMEGSIRSEIQRRKKQAEITGFKNQATTNGVTSKARDLTRQYVTLAVQDRFTRESDRLSLEQVALGDHGGDKGMLKHKPELIGATGSLPEEVLSEGEQTALGLAGFFTEIFFDSSKSAVVLDDPITSLDHARRAKVAARLAIISRDRQVVAFTHDLTFLGDLLKAAENKGVKVFEQSIMRQANKPGYISDSYPWKAKQTPARLQDLEERLAQMKKEQADLPPEQFEEKVKLWAGDLSETWERMVRAEIVNKVVDRATQEVRPKMIKLLAKITQADDDDYQEGYSEVSKWAPRHDKSEETNFVVPSIGDMKNELDRTRSWYNRIKGYAA